MNTSSTPAPITATPAAPPATHRPALSTSTPPSATTGSDGAAREALGRDGPRRGGGQHTRQDHCGGGAGPNTFDSIGTLEAWREKGTAPAEITAFNPQTGLSRPVCPYPQYAKYKGSGNLKDAANWACSAP